MSYILLEDMVFYCVFLVVVILYWTVLPFPIIAEETMYNLQIHRYKSEI